MATFVLINAKHWHGGYDLTPAGTGPDVGGEHQVKFGYTIDAVGFNKFGSNGQRRKAGLWDVMAEFQGYVDLGAGLADESLWTLLAQDDQVTTISATGQEGDIAYTLRGVQLEHDYGENIGDAFQYSGRFMGNTVGVRGTLLEDGQTARTASANGTARQLGQVLAGERVYSALHVVAASGGSPTLDVTVESDTASGMPSPTTRITHPTQTAIGADWQSAQGAITDDWWRVAWTIGGSGPSFNFVTVVGIV